MSVLYIVLPLALVIVAVAVAAFVWATNRGQFDDLETPAMRMVLDDDGTPRRTPHAGPATPPSAAPDEPKPR